MAVKNFGNRSTFGKVIGNSILACFFLLTLYIHNCCAGQRWRVSEIRVMKKEQKQNRSRWFYFVQRVTENYKPHKTYAFRFARKRFPVFNSKCGGVAQQLRQPTLTWHTLVHFQLLLVCVVGGVSTGKGTCCGRKVSLCICGCREVQAKVKDAIGGLYSIQEPRRGARLP